MAASVFAVINIITNIITLIDFSVEIYDRAKGFSDDSKDIPKALRNINQVLPSVSASLRKTQEQIKSGGIDEFSCRALQPLLEGCVGELCELFKRKSYLPTMQRN